MKGPTHDAEPDVDDHFVREGARVEVVDGHLVMAPPAEEPHATAHFSLAVVLGAHVAPGYRGAVDMLTRTSKTSDFAPDASVFPAAPRPETRRRQLEELAFEIASTQPLEDAGNKARELVRRGVRRVFCILLKRGKLLEWSRATDGWSPLPDAAEIDDRCFVRPVPVRALLDATAADDAVIQALITRDAVVDALIARGHPKLDEIEARGEALGRARAEAESVVTLLRARGLVVTAAHAAVIESADRATVARWFQRAITVASADELFDEH